MVGYKSRDHGPGRIYLEERFNASNVQFGGRRGGVVDAVCGPPRSSLSSKSLAASICITYASGATVCYTIGIHLVGLMTGTKGDDAMRRRDHLRYASLFSLSPFFSPFAFVYRPKYAFILKRYLVSRLDEISVTGTSNRNDSNSFGVFFFFFFRIAQDKWWKGD